MLLHCFLNAGNGIQCPRKPVPLIFKVFLLEQVMEGTEQKPAIPGLTGNGY